VLDHLDPERKYIQHRLFRENCVATEEGVYIKDLRIFSNRNMSDMIIVDNAAYSFAFQVDNGLPIIPYYENKNDEELLILSQYLKAIYQVKDVREINRKVFKLNRFLDFQDPLELIQEVFPEYID
jgi:CTD small phosphatase-like protein 2